MNVIVVILVAVCGFAGGWPRAICPNPTIMARKGHNITLQCSLDPPMNLVKDIVDVKTLDNEVVHSYRHGSDRQPQAGQYRNRTTLNREQLTRGIQEVQLSSVNESDSRPYKCNFPRWKTWCLINVTLDQENWTKRDDFSTTGPPLDEMDKPGGENWKLAVAIAIPCVFFLIALVLALMKLGMITNCRKGQQAEVVTMEMENLRARTTD